MLTVEVFHQGVGVRPHSGPHRVFANNPEANIHYYGNPSIGGEGSHGYP